MQIIITESQFSLLLQESLGINKDIINIAKLIINDILESYVNIDDYEEEIHDSYEYNMSDLMDDIGISGIVYNGNAYYYGFYYQISNSKGKFDYDNDAVMINYYGIQNIINKAVDFYGKNEEDAKSFIETSLYEYLLPIIIHELTHSLDQYGEAQGKWLGNYYKGNEEDLKDILYVFSENEMNARVGSVGGVVTSMIENTYMNNIPSREEFDNFVDDILEENDLQVNYMKVLLDTVLKSDLENFQKQEDKNAKINYKKYSLLFDLFRNDERLKTNRKLKQMFNSNSFSAYKYVFDFYDRLLERYIRKIKRAIYEVWKNYQN